MNLKKFFYQKILNRKYYREGKCNRCGGCCKDIYIRHKNSVIKSEEEFNEIKNSCSFYKHITITGKDDFGLTFTCNNFDEEKKLCKTHFLRPKICRNYPSEQIFSFGAMLHKTCGFRFEPIESFKEVLEKAAR